MTADAITTNNSGTLFDHVSFVGYNGTYTLEVITGSPNILRLTLTDSTLSNQTFNTNSFTMYPNPTKGIIHIKGNNITIKDVTLYNLLGQNCTNSLTMVNSKTIDVTTLPVGVYILSINGVKKTIIKE